MTNKMKKEIITKITSLDGIIALYWTLIGLMVIYPCDGMIIFCQGFFISSLPGLIMRIFNSNHE